MDSRAARLELTGLVDAGVATAEGERRGRVYRLAATLIGNQRTGRAANPGAGSFPRQQSDRTRNEKKILTQLETGPKAATELVAATGLSTRQVQYALQHLRDTGAVTLIGSRGQRDSRYELTSHSNSES